MYGSEVEPEAAIMSVMVANICVPALHPEDFDSDVPLSASLAAVSFLVLAANGASDVVV